MNYYETLGVERDATQAVIQKAYRKLASKHHPDREGGDAKAFQEAEAAYRCLGDPAKRRIYDMTGQDAGDVSIQSEALDLVTQMVWQAVEAGAYNVVSTCFAKLASDAMTNASSRRTTQLRKRTLEKKRGRYLKKKPGDNLIHRVIDKAIENADSNIKLMDRVELILQAATEILNDYSEIEEPVNKPTYLLDRR